MDPRQAGVPFSRPQSQQTLRDPRFSSLPASQYASQPNTPRQDTLHKHDPFLRRKNDLDDPRGAPALVQGPPQYGPPTTHYSVGQVMAVQDPITNNGQLRRNSQNFGPARTDRFGSQSSEGVDTRELGRSAQQSSGLLSSAPTLNFVAAQQPRNIHNNAQTQVINRVGSPRAYGVDYQPAPAPFTGRQMLPPSPQVPQAHHNILTTSSHAPQTSFPFSNGRDLPALSMSTNHRPSSSMSISSMLGSDSLKSSRELGPANLGNGPSSLVGNFLISPTGPSNHANSPPRIGQSSSVLLERSSSPDKYRIHQAQAGRPNRSYSGGFDQRPPALAQGYSAEGMGNGSLQGPTISQYSPNSVPGSQRDWNHHQQRQNGRPSSQPAGFSTSPIMLLGEVERIRQQQTARKHYVDLEESNRDVNVRAINGEPISRDAQQRAEPSQKARTVPNNGAHRSPDRERLNGLNQDFLSRHVTNSENTSPHHRSEIGRPLEREHHSSNVVVSPFSSESLRQLREERQVLRQQSAAQLPASHQPRVNNHAGERQPPRYPGPPVTFANSTEPPITLEASEQQQGREDLTPSKSQDLNPTNRSALALLIESSRRGGRFSPLPQAVQGAQGKTSGPASDPGIKNEFARMFSGIGSGVGSAGRAGSGTNTPFAPPSPTIGHETQRRTPFANRMDLTTASKPRTASKSSRRSRRIKDDESKAVLEDGEANTPNGATTRVSKRARGSHHHHPYHVHRAHRHHNLEEVDGSNEGSAPTLANGRRTNTPLQMGVGPHRHHNHHHGIHHHHHHHQEPKPPRIPTTVIRNDAVMERISLYPREHLGTVMYSSTLEPARTTASSGAKFRYRSTPTPMPRYEGKENCTYTVRVPEVYLGSREREEICRRRALWGTDIYTDDSDVIAAAIHSGWLRGEFGDDVDPAILEIGRPSKADNKTDKPANGPHDVFTSPPNEPMVPPPGKELRLTLLVLPALEKYTSHISHGIKSRSWGNTHDGVSFRIEKMEWVHSSRGNGEDRSGEARRKRIRSQFGGDGAMDGPSVRLDRHTMAAGTGVEKSTGLVAVDA